MSAKHFIELAFYISAGLLTYAYVLYPLLLALLPPAGSSQDEAGDAKPMTRWPWVSVIVAAYNEERVIAGKIKNFLESNYPGRSEILIASDGSTDATNAIVRRLASEKVRLIVQEPRQGKGAALNRAVPRARGEILVFTDATSMFTAETLTELVRPFADPGVGLVNGRIQYKGSRIANLYHHYEQLLKLLEVRGGLIATAHGAIYALRKVLWRQHDPRFANDFFDPIVVNLQGARAALARRALCVEQFSPPETQFGRQVRMVALAALVYFKLLPQLLRAHRWRSVVVLTSHKLLRWLTAVWLVLLALTTPLLAPTGGIYRLALEVEAIGVVLAGLGLLAKELGWSERAAFLYQFLALNFAAVVGLWLCVRGQVPAVWEPNGGYAASAPPERASARPRRAGVDSIPRAAGEAR